MAEAINPREKRAAIAAIFLVVWPLCWLALYLLVVAGVVDPAKIQAWLGEKLPVRFLQDPYRDTILSLIWIPFAASVIAFPAALRLAPRVVSRFGHLNFLSLPAGFREDHSRRRRWFRERRETETTDVVRYRFSSRALPFLGRRKELQALDEFTGKPEKLLWWWMTGGPGTGKSRMALEWVLSLQGRTGGLFARTDAGFLPRSAADHTWSEWEPRRRTVIVIDDAGARTEEVKRILRTLSERQSRFGFHVRVLLVDRNIDEGLRELNGDPVCGADRYKEPLALAGLPECLDEMAKAIAARTARRFTLTLHGRDRILELTGGSPLFMTWALESIARTGEPLWADWQALLRLQIDRFESELQQSGLSAACVPVLALATLSRGLSWTAAKKFRPELTDEDTRRLIRLRHADSDSVFAVQPDLLGEYFLLEQFALFAGDERERFRALAWNLQRVRTRQTLYYLHRDFPDHPQLAELDQRPDDPDAAQEWGMLRVYLRAEREDENRNRTYRQDLLDLAATGDARLALPLACDAFNRIKEHGRKREWPGVNAAWRELQDVAERFPEDAAMQFRLASGAVSTLVAFGTGGQWDDATQAWTTLKAITGRFRESADMQLELAMGSRDVVLYFGEAGMWDQTLAAWAELQATARQFPSVPAIQIELAKGAVDLIAYCEAADRHGLLNEVWHVLETAAAATPDDPAVQEWLAMGASNRMPNVRDAKQIGACWRVLLDLASRFEEHIQLQRNLTFGAANAILIFVRAGDRAGVADACRQLEALSKRAPKDAELQTAVARGTVYEMNYHADAANWADFDRTWERLRWIAEAFPTNVPINVQTAKGAYQAYVSYLSIRERKKLDNAWLWLEQINARFPGHPEIVPLVEDAPFSPYKVY